MANWYLLVNSVAHSHLMTKIKKDYERGATCFYDGLSVLRRMGFPIRKPPDHRIMAPPRRVSPPCASFLGMSTQGIHCQLFALQETKDPSPFAPPKRSYRETVISTCIPKRNCAVVSNPQVDYPLRCNYSCTVFWNFTSTVQSFTC